MPNRTPYAQAFRDQMVDLVRSGVDADTDLWGYAADETLSATDLIAVRYRGIRLPESCTSNNARPAASQTLPH